MALARKFKLDRCSEEIDATIEKSNRKLENPLPRRDTVVPWCKMRVGESLWFDCDMLTAEEIRSIQISKRRYNKDYGEMFVDLKHRGDLRKSGFKYLEIARIK